MSDKKVYLVGGAVRDKLLDLPNYDKDWLVVGSSPESMLSAGYKQVGQDFPVFLHPETHEEYALARIERKDSIGYQGFKFDFNPNITLEQDLKRRDLTINAIAEDENGKLLDPFYGFQDLKNKVLRHVSDAFVEDPLRILRVARFAAKFSDFSIACETLDLMKKLVACNELTSLSAERVWLETSKALTTQAPSRYFRVLAEVNALQILFPEIHNLIDKIQPHKHHPEGDAFEHTMLTLEKMRTLSDSLDLLTASLCHDFGKGITSPDCLPHHPNHEQKGIEVVKNFCKRLKISKKITKLALLGTQYHGYIYHIDKLSATTKYEFFKSVKAFKDLTTLKQILLISQADLQGRGQEYCYKEFDYFQKWLDLINKINQPIDYSKLAKNNIAEAIEKIYTQRIELL